jgi:hypothetical protein
MIFLLNFHFELLASCYWCKCFIAGVNDTGDVVETGEQLIAVVVYTGDKQNNCEYLREFS